MMLNDMTNSLTNMTKSLVVRTINEGIYNNRLKSLLMNYLSDQDIMIHRHRIN